MKIAKKLLNIVLATTLLVCGTTVARAASLSVLFTEGFENTEAAGEYAGTNEKSYVVTVDDTNTVEVSIPVGNAENWKGKNLVAEAWYHIDGTVTPYSYSNETGASGTQLTMAFCQTDGMVVTYSPNKDRVYSFENAVYPNTAVDGWHRIRTACRIDNDADVSASTIAIRLTGAAENVKLYIDNIKIFVTDNLVDMFTQGNADFETYDASSINGWELHGTSTTASYSKLHPASGSYGVEIKRTSDSNAGIMQSVAIHDFCDKENDYVVGSLTTYGVYGTGGSFQSVSKQMLISASKNTVFLGAYGVPYIKTEFSSILQTKDISVGNLILRLTTSGTNFKKDTALYVDDVIIKVVSPNGFLGFAKVTTYSNALKYYAVDSIADGDVVYPYAYFTTARTEETTILVAKYQKNNNGLKSLVDFSVQTYPSYGKGIDLLPGSLPTTSPISAENGYTYRIMAWDSVGNLTALLDTTTYEVK